MAIDAQLVQILVCPDDFSSLQVAADEQVQRVNEAIAKKRLHNRGGEPVHEPIDQLLVRSDGQYGYAIRADIPVMLVEESIPLHQIAKA